MPSHGTIPRACHQCGAIFLAPAHDVARGYGKFCSRACYGAAKAVPLRPVAERFWQKVNKTEACWLWTGKTNGRKGYGQIGIGSKPAGTMAHAYVHRVSWELHYGAIPDGLVVMHTCDVPLCVRPDHLELGTVADNNRDMFAKGRGKPGCTRGEAQSNSKLTVEIVQQIRVDFAAGVPQRELGRRYGVQPAAISKVVTGRSWKHVR